jgi:hypothetical protein
MTGVLGDLANQRGQRLANDVDTTGLVVVDALDAVQRLGRIQQRRTTTGDDALFDCRAGRVQRVVDAVLALLDLDLGRTADLDDGDAASELGQTLLELLAVVIAGGVLDLRTDRLGAALDRVGFTRTIDDGGVVLELILSHLKNLFPSHRA